MCLYKACVWNIQAIVIRLCSYGSIYVCVVYDLLYNIMGTYNSGQRIGGVCIAWVYIR